MLLRQKQNFPKVIPLFAFDALFNTSVHTLKVQLRLHLLTVKVTVYDSHQLVFITLHL